MHKSKIKICCISSLSEAEIAVKYGASAIGLVSEMPSGPGIISEELIRTITKEYYSKVDTFLLTSRLKASEIIEQQKFCGTNTIQICDRITHDNLILLKEKIPKIKLVQALHVHYENTLREALDIEKYVDAILLDSGNQKKEIKELGGTGRTHNWKISKKIVASVSVPVFLAGGLNPANVKNAVEIVNPYGLDVCSGVRTDGLLDELKLKQFFEAAGYTK